MAPISDKAGLTDWLMISVVNAGVTLIMFISLKPMSKNGPTLESGLPLEIKNNASYQMQNSLGMKVSNFWSQLNADRKG